MKSIVTFRSFVSKVTCFVCKDTYFFDIKNRGEAKIFNFGLPPICMYSLFTLPLEPQPLLLEQPQLSLRGYDG